MSVNEDEVKAIADAIRTAVLTGADLTAICAAMWHAGREYERQLAHEEAS